jgi:hypothetical protein
MKNVFLITISILSIISCSTTETYKPTFSYIKIGASDSYTLSNSVDRNSIYKATNFNPEADKQNLLMVSMGGIDTFSYRGYLNDTASLNLVKVDPEDEDFSGLLRACSEKASFEKVDTWALQTGMIATSATIGAAGAVAGASSAAAAASAAAVAGPLILVMTAVGGAGAYIQNEREETIKRGVALYGCLAENGYQAEPYKIGEMALNLDSKKIDNNEPPYKPNENDKPRIIDATLDTKSFSSNASASCKKLLSKNKPIRNNEISFEFIINVDKYGYATDVKLSDDNVVLNYATKSLVEVAINALKKSQYKPQKINNISKDSIINKTIKFPKNYCT